MYELKPCPLCGGKAIIMAKYDSFRKKMEYGVYCSQCCATMERVFQTQNNAVAQWNRRIDDKDETD